jgi:hypothetical protein
MRPVNDGLSIPQGRSSSGKPHFKELAFFLNPGTFNNWFHWDQRFTMEEIRMKYALMIATVAAIATPALADDVGVRVGPAGAGVTVGESHDRDRDRDRAVIKEREPDRDRTTVIKKEHRDGDESKTVIHHDRD